MGTMTLAIPNDLKQEMNVFPVINWSEVAREAFKEKIEELKILKEITFKSKLTEKDALELGKKINASIAKKHEKGK
ncbi:MAG: hypothetical protein JW703_04330 [Candidatus Diapherotrites archaeon]|nr:hypothetical protein [Candidatus Diapherotrites archaeon]